MDVDVASSLLRVSLGVMFVLHGWNHGFGPGGLTGTTAWFQSIGLRPAKVHAAVSSYLEIAVGIALLAGLLVPLAAAAGIGIMCTAGVTAHRGNGFFIFKDGYEYVLIVAVSLTSLATLGAGEWSVDHAIGLDGTLGADLDGWMVGLAAVGLGVASSAATLGLCWRPPAQHSS